MNKHIQVSEKDKVVLTSDIEKARLEIERLRLWHKEVALRRKRTFELERQSKEAEELEQQAMERKKVEAEESKLLQRQQLIEFRRLKRAEEQEARRQWEEQKYIDNKALYDGMTKTPLYHHLAQTYKEKRDKDKQHQQSHARRGGGGQLSPRKLTSPPPTAHSPSRLKVGHQNLQSQVHSDKPHSESRVHTNESEKRVYKGKTTMHLIYQEAQASLLERQRRQMVFQQKEAAKAKHAKQAQYSVLVREMFAPSVDTQKRKEVEIRQATTKSQRTQQKAPVALDQGEPKAIPPEARGKLKPKDPNIGKLKPNQPSDKENAVLQFGNIRIVKSAKQIAEDREATVAQWQTRAKTILNTLSQKEAQFTVDLLAPLHLRFAKHAMVSSMYCDTISAKLDLLSELCNM